jgi:hypothetical protein
VCLAGEGVEGLVALPADVQQMHAPARILTGSGQEQVSLADYLRCVVVAAVVL